ncbi:MAG: AHH domain-containing protein [Sphingobacteriales bacterium]|nr:AHH domain-containing protein [Sphingobacteriales bacterium]
MFLFGACQKPENDELLSPEPTTQFDNGKIDGDDNDCVLYQNFEAEFCWKLEINNASNLISYFNDPSNSCRNCVGKPFIINGGGKQYTVQPYSRPDAGVDFLVTDGSTRYLLSNTTSIYVKQVKSSTAPNKNLSVVYRVAQEVLKSGYNMSQIGSKLGSAAQPFLLSDGTLKLNVSSNFAGDNLSTLSRYEIGNLCENQKRQVVNLYMEKLGFTSASSTYTYEYMINVALSNCGFSCSGNGLLSVASACADPICVFNGIMGQINANNTTDQQKVQRAFLQYGLGLSAAEVAAISLPNYSFITSDLYDALIDSETFCQRADNLKALTGSLSQYIETNSNATPAIAQQCLDFESAKNYDVAATQASQLMLHLLGTPNGLVTAYETGLYNAPFIFSAPTMFSYNLYKEYQTQCAILRKAHPRWTDLAIGLEATWLVLGGYVHTGLDICGLIPAAGEPCDFTNGILYTIEGDGVHATLSFAATLPILGWIATAGKYAKIGVNTAAGYVELVLKQDASGLITHELPDWWNATFRSMVGVTDPLMEAHHLIPKAIYDNAVIQKASQSIDIPYHIHHPKNGLGILKIIHDGPHNLYSDAIRSKLGSALNPANGTIAKKMTDIYGSLDAAPAEVVQEEVVLFQNWLRNLLQNNPNTPLNQLDNAINLYNP